MDTNTKDDLKEIRKVFQAAMKERDAGVIRVWNETDEDTKLAITKYVMDRIWEHAIEGGSYRYLIYDRLGFSMAAYTYLYPVGMNISNEFDVSNKKDIL
jgi:methionine salvage enolase-phosphatase E1